MGVSVRQKDGNWYIFLRHRGERAAQRYDNEEEAQAVAQAVRHAITLGQFDIAAMKQRREAPPKDERPAVPTLTEYYEKTFQPVYLESAIALSTAGTYANVFKNHITPALGTLRLDEITHNQMEDFISNLVKKKLAKATIQTIVKDLCTLFNHARKRKVVQDNPASGLSQLYSQAKGDEVIEPLTREEVPLFLAAVRERKESKHHYALFFTAIHTGVRQGELAGLKTGDLDFNGKYLVVQRAIDRIHSKIVPTKTKRIRRIDLSDELIAVLKDHVRQQTEAWFTKPLKEGEERGPQPEWLFPNEKGSWPDMRNIAERHFHKCMDKAGLHRRRAYDLRHTFASLLLTAGAPIAYVSEQMGHANIQLTVKRYGHLQPGANRHWMNKLPGEKKTKIKRSVATSGNWRQKIKKAANEPRQVVDIKAGHGIRTRDFDLGKVPKDDESVE